MLAIYIYIYIYISHVISFIFNFGLSDSPTGATEPRANTEKKSFMATTTTNQQIG